MPLLDTPIYCAAWAFCRTYCTVYHRLSVSGRENLPTSGPALVVCNHASNIDPVIVGSAMSWRRPRYMAKAELFSNPMANWLLRSFGAFPVRRGLGDRAAIQEAKNALQSGEVLILFPEGTRSRDGEVHPFNPGVTLLAVSVPRTLVVPARIRGSYEAFGRHRKFPRPSRISVTVGKPFIPEELPDLPTGKKSLYRAVADEMFTRIVSL